MGVGGNGPLAPIGDRGRVTPAPQGCASRRSPEAASAAGRFWRRGPFGAQRTFGLCRCFGLTRASPDGKGSVPWEGPDGGEAMSSRRVLDRFGSDRFDGDGARSDF